MSLRAAKAALSLFHRPRWAKAASATRGPVKRVNVKSFAMQVLEIAGSVVNKALTNLGET